MDQSTLDFSATTFDRIDANGDQELSLDELINSQILPEWVGTWGKWVWGSWIGPERAPAEQ